MPKLISIRKQKWMAQFKPQKIKGTPLIVSASVTKRYYDALAKLIEKMTATTMREAEVFYKQPHAKEYFAEDASVASQARILTNALIAKFQPFFNAEAKPLAETMVEQTDTNSEVTLRSSLKELSGGLTLNTDFLTAELNDILTATIAENVGLIKSIGSQYLEGVQGAVMRSITTGNGLQDLVPYLEKQKGITLRRARNIAFDQTHKLYANLNRARMQKLGVEEYEWLHTGGSQQPRKLHQSYTGKIFRMDDPPIIDQRTGERGHPGTAINCRCRMIPIIKFDDAAA